MTPVESPSPTLPRLLGARLLAAASADLRTHHATYGPLPVLQPDRLIAELHAAGLAGRGGAGFPAARKLLAVRRAAIAQSRVIVVANGGEGEPRSAKDATLLCCSPHLVIDGLLVLAGTVGASELVIHARVGQLPALQKALSERSDAAGIRLHEAHDSFLSGEASAVVNALEGRRPIPVDHVERLGTSGFRGRPTLVQNVETLANAALIARYGAAWFRTVGTVADPGSRLVSVSSSTPGSAPQVLEVAAGTPVRTILHAAGIDSARASAALVGGYHGTWIPQEAFDTPFSTDHLEPWAARPGAGVIIALDRTDCPIRFSAGIAAYLAEQSARQCGPCVNGLPAMARLLARLAHGDASRESADDVRRLAALVTGRGSCHHPDGTARFVLSTLSVFEAEVAAHLAGSCLRAS